MLKKKYTLSLLALFLIPRVLFAEPIYFPTEEKTVGMLGLESTFLSLGAELDTGFLSSQGDNHLAFTNGNQGVTHTNEEKSKFQINKLTLIPQANVDNKIKLYAELEARTQRNQLDTTFFRKGYLSFFIPWHFFVKVGVDDRFISPEFMATNDALGDNKKLTEVYPINGTAFWKDEDLGITVGGDHPLGVEDTFLYWRASLTNGLSLDHDEITRNQIYPILQDDRDAQNLNFDLTDNKELGVGLGLKHAFSSVVSANTFGFFFDSNLATRDISFLRDVITGYLYSSNTRQRSGVNGELNIKNFNLFTQYVHAKDGKVNRDGFYIQPSFLVFLSQDRKFFNNVRFLYRFNMLDVKVTGLGDNISTSPFTWDRITHSFAVNLQIHKYVLFRNEFHLNREITGAADSQVKNNEFLSQLELRF